MEDYAEAQPQSNKQQGIGPQFRRLVERLYGAEGSQITNINLFPGDAPVSPEYLAEQVNLFFDALERSEIEPFEGGVEPVHVAEEPIEIEQYPEGTVAIA